jgi:hypothetical protein
MKAFFVATLVFSTSFAFAQRTPVKGADRAAELVKALIKSKASETCFSVDTQIKRVTGQEQVNKLSKGIADQFVKESGFEFTTVEEARAYTAENSSLSLKETFNDFAVQELLTDWIKEEPKEQRQELRRIIGTKRYSPVYHLGWYDDGAEITGRDLYVIPLTFDKENIDVLSIGINYCED